MWIQGSTLSISQRSLLPERPLSPLQARAQTLSSLLIQSYTSRRAVQDALSFIEEHLSSQCVFEDDILSFTLSPLTLASLGIPAGFGVKGGAAREVLISGLSLRTAQQPRDIDLVRRGAYRIPADDEVGRAFMGRDFEHGARVELIRDLSGYIRSRLMRSRQFMMSSTHLSCARSTRSGTFYARPGTEAVRFIDSRAFSVRHF
jgi:hypothetical protein